MTARPDPGAGKPFGFSGLDAAVNALLACEAGGSGASALASAWERAVPAVRGITRRGRRAAGRARGSPGPSCQPPGCGRRPGAPVPAPGKDAARGTLPDRSESSSRPQPASLSRSRAWSKRGARCLGGAAFSTRWRITSMTACCIAARRSPRAGRLPASGEGSCGRSAAPLRSWRSPRKGAVSRFECVRFRA